MHNFYTRNSPEKSLSILFGFSRIFLKNMSLLKIIVHTAIIILLVFEKRSSLSLVFYLGQQAVILTQNHCKLKSSS